VTIKEAEVLKIFWDKRPVEQRKNILDIMTLKNWEKETISSLINKGLVEKISFRFVRLTSKCNDFLLYTELYIELYNVNITKYID
jgi:predicted transcriptional regulator